MSFNNNNSNGFGPFDGNQPPFWQMLALVVVPAFVGACLPPVIAHFLERSKPQPPPPPPAPVAAPPPAGKPPSKPKKEKGA
jgi:hypothetical protein